MEHVSSCGLYDTILYIQRCSGGIGGQAYHKMLGVLSNFDSDCTRDYFWSFPRFKVLLVMPMEVL